ncbi:MAG: Holliday junction branch migration protein RuvA [Candidatus Nanopelagicales bacterium]
MIASLSGGVAAVHPSAVVIDVSGVGILVACTPQTAASVRVGDPLMLHTSLIVREESLTLYGFVDTEQRDVFDLVQTVSGIGPRTALAVLSTLAPDDLRRAISADDVASLTRVPGIGSKGAQRMIIELKDRLRSVQGSHGAHATDGPETVREALVSLGWSAKDAERAVTAVSGDGDADTSSLLREALRYLDRR